MSIYNTIFKKIVFALLLFICNTTIHAQTTTVSSDQELKDNIYNQYKKAVLNYSMKNFDAMFSDFLVKQNDQNYTFTREEFYTFTVKIATFSDRLAKLYPERKEEAATNKAEWMAKSYDEYLQQKTTKK